MKSPDPRRLLILAFIGIAAADSRAAPVVECGKGETYYPQITGYGTGNGTGSVQNENASGCVRQVSNLDPAEPLEVIDPKTRKITHVTNLDHLPDKDEKDSGSFASKGSKDPTGEQEACNRTQLSHEFQKDSELKTGSTASTDAKPVTSTAQDPAMGTVPVSQPAHSMSGMAGDTNAIADRAIGMEVVDSMISKRNEIENQAFDDYQELAAPYQTASISELKERLMRARNNLGEDARDLGAARSGFPLGEKSRFQRLLQSARDLADFGVGVIEGAQADNTLDTPFKPLVRPGAIPNPLAKSAALGELFGTEMPRENATSNQSLIDRLVFHGGLTDPERKKAAARIRLAETPTITLPSGLTRPITVLHNGYFLGGGKTGLDCSAFVSSVLPAEVRKGQFTTLDFASMWRYLRKGKIPDPPHYEPQRLKLVQRTAGAFVPINLYRGDTLRIGDLVVYRLPWEAIGHVFVVRTYSPPTMLASIIEIAQSSGKIQEKDFPLSLDRVDRAERRIRPGLMVLRLKPVSNTACSYKDPKGKAPL